MGTQKDIHMGTQQGSYTGCRGSTKTAAVGGASEARVRSGRSSLGMCAVSTIQHVRLEAVHNGIPLEWGPSVPPPTSRDTLSSQTPYARNEENKKPYISSVLTPHPRSAPQVPTHRTALHMPTHTPPPWIPHIALSSLPSGRTPQAAPGRASFTFGFKLLHRQDSVL